jgi:asparagine synthase (glutamine-hydrolysing)
MCGITGFLDRNASTSQAELLDRARAMALRLQHRGPDDAGEWADAASGVALGFRRLSIIDISPAGHQPMLSATGRYVIIFNGEVYNFEAIRARLVAENIAPSFRGHSDTEVILAAIEAWGLEASVRLFIGMFGFALWDRETETLSLVRDRVGVKPLYYGTCGRTFFFGSELKAFAAHPAFRPVINRDAVGAFMRFSYVPTPLTIYDGFCKVPPGAIVSVTAATAAAPEVRGYWSAADIVAFGLAHPFGGSENDAVEHLDHLLRDAVGLRMISDVPLGVFLSGGIDSTLVTAQMQAQSGRPVKTFSIGFYEDTHDETRYARLVAQHLGTEHTEMYVTPSQALDVIPLLPEIYDEPFSDSSQIPTYLVSKLARQHVTVALSGDGGDELFGGYDRYVLGQKLWSSARLAPRPLRTAFAGAAKRIPPATWERILRAAQQLVPRSKRFASPADKLLKLFDVVSASSSDELYRHLMSHWNEQVVPGAKPLPPVDSVTHRFVERGMSLDLITYLPDDILAKVDRASMAVSLEAREPLLDHRLIEFAWTLPLSLKVRGGRGKWVLRRVLDRYVPPALMDRPKMGFGVPIALWLRGSLRDWAEDLLSAQSLGESGFFDSAAIRRRWQEHVSGMRNWQYHIWDVLMFQAWLRT